MASSSLLLLVLFLFSLHIIVSPNNLVETIYHTQRVDHFEDDNPLNPATFTQRVYIDRSFWHGAENRDPILVYFGGESPLTEDFIGSCGLITESAPLLGALVIYIEHRFYGLSVPYGSVDRAMSDPKVRECFTTSQALEDAHEIIVGVQRNMSAQHSPVIVMGGSYAGVLAALFRLRYPLRAIGAVASSTPMYFDFSHSKDFYSIISKDFQEISHDCHDKIRQSWKVIDDRAKKPRGLDYLSQTFGTCDGRFGEQINTVCGNVVDPPNGNLIEGIARAINATRVLTLPCVDISNWYEQAPFFLDQNMTEAWRWQLCNELIIPFHSEQETMFPVQSFNFTYYLAYCEAIYGVELHPWAIEKNDISTILDGSTSNIIFTNGLRDPYSSVGVLEDISETIVAINTNNGSHCLDMVQAQPDDPIWLVDQRRQVRRRLIEWINKTQDPNSSCSSLRPQLWIILLWLLLYFVVN